jgi:hypothetical protein
MQFFKRAGIGFAVFMVATLAADAATRQRHLFRIGRLLLKPGAAVHPLNPGLGESRCRQNPAAPMSISRQLGNSGILCSRGWK